MSAALKQLVALVIAALLLAVTVAFPGSAAPQATTTAPNGQNPNSIARAFATPLAGQDPSDAATGADLIRKRFELITQVVPGVGRVAVLWHPGEDIGRRMRALQDVGKTAWALGLNLRFLAADDVSQLEAAFSDISTGDVDAVLVLSSRMFLLEREYIVQMIAKAGLPAVYDTREFVESGGLMSYGPNQTELEQYNISGANKIMEQGHSQGHAAQAERPMKLELVVNMRTARKLGISFSPKLLMLVDKSID